MTCKCVDTMNEHLAKMNTRLAQALMADVTGPGKAQMAPRLIILTVKVNEKKRGKPHTALASFCPFCGKKP